MQMGALSKQFHQLVQTLPAVDLRHAFLQREVEDTIAELGKILDGYPAEQELNAEIAQKLEQFFSKRWKRIRRTRLAYIFSPFHPITQICATVAKHVAPLVGKSAWRVLMDSITHEEDMNGIKLSELELYEFILSDDGERFIPIKACLEFAVDDKTLKHTTLFGQTYLSLSPLESERVIEHSKYTRAVFRVTSLLHELTHNMETIGGALKTLKEALLAGGKQVNGAVAEHNALTPTSVGVYKFHEWMNLLTPEEVLYLRSLTASNINQDHKISEEVGDSDELTTRDDDVQDMGDILDRLFLEVHEEALSKLWLRKRWFAMQELVYEVKNPSAKMISQQLLDIMLLRLKSDNPALYAAVMAKSNELTAAEEKIVKGYDKIVYCGDMLAEKIDRILIQHPELFSKKLTNLDDDEPCVHLGEYQRLYQTSMQELTVAMQGEAYPIEGCPKQCDDTSLWKYYGDMLPSRVPHVLQLGQFMQYLSQAKATSDDYQQLFVFLKPVLFTMLDHRLNALARRRYPSDVHPIVYVLQNMPVDKRYLYVKALQGGIESRVVAFDDMILILQLLLVDGVNLVINEFVHSLAGLIKDAKQFLQLMATLRLSVEAESTDNISTYMRSVDTDLKRMVSSAVYQQITIAASLIAGSLQSTGMYGTQTQIQIAPLTTSSIQKNQLHEVALK